MRYNVFLRENSFFDIFSYLVLPTLIGFTLHFFLFACLRRVDRTQSCSSARPGSGQSDRKIGTRQNDSVSRYVLLREDATLLDSQTLNNIVYTYYLGDINWIYVWTKYFGIWYSKSNLSPDSFQSSYLPPFRSRQSLVDTIECVW